VDALKGVSDHSDLKTEYMDAQTDVVVDQLRDAGVKLADFIQLAFSSE
jgi:hypothetical protein